MRDLISRGELFNRLANVWTLEEAYAVIQDMPAKEITLCKDCQKYDTHDHRCKWWNHGMVVLDWCSRAERMENG